MYGGSANDRSGVRFLSFFSHISLPKEEIVEEHLIAILDEMLLKGMFEEARGLLKIVEPTFSKHDEYLGHLNALSGEEE